MADTQSPKTGNMGASLGKLETTLEEYLVKKAPFAIPTGIKDFIVMIAPWFTLIGVIMSIPAVLVVFGLGAIVAPMAFLGGAQAGATFSLSIIFLIITLVLNALAIPGLFKRSRSGWNFVFYATLVGVVQNIVAFNLGGLIIGSVIGLYVLFQLKERYR